MILGKGLWSENCRPKKNFKMSLTQAFFGKRKLFGAHELHLSNSFGYFSDPVKFG